MDILTHKLFNYVPLQVSLNYNCESLSECFPIGTLVPSRYATSTVPSRALPGLRCIATIVGMDVKYVAYFKMLKKSLSITMTIEIFSSASRLIGLLMALS